MQEPSTVMDDLPPKLPDHPAQLLDKVRALIREQNKPYTTEKTHIQWIKRFIRFNHRRHPNTLSTADIERYLNSLTNTNNCSPATQATALNAIIFLYVQFLGRDLSDLNFEFSRTKARVPVVFSKLDAKKIINLLHGDKQLMANLMYGSGLRVSECLRLRVKDIDFDHNQIMVQQSSGEKYQATLLPERLILDLAKQIDIATEIHRRDLSSGYGAVYMPNTLAEKYPSASTSINWQYIFPSTKISKGPRDGVAKRHHVHQRTLQRAVKNAISLSAVRQHANCHTFRHSFVSSHF